MIARRFAWLACAAVAAFGAPTFADEENEPSELVHVPVGELDVLLKADRKGVVLNYAEYRRLLDAAQARAKRLAAEPPVDGALVSAEGSMDLTAEKAARLSLRYAATVLADGPRSVGFPLRGIALESIEIAGREGASGGRYEEFKGRPRIRFDGPGSRDVTVTASATYARKGEGRFLDVVVPPASAMALAVTFPPGVEGFIAGEGPPVTVQTEGSRPKVVRVRPGRQGRLRLAFAPAAKGVDGPPILDTQTHGVFGPKDGILHADVIVQVDVFRTAVDALTLRVPEDFNVHDLGGNSVTGFRRSDDRQRVVVDLDKPRLGRLELKLRGERRYAAGPGIEIPRVTVQDAVRHRAQVALRVSPDVNARDVVVEGGHRVAPRKDERDGTIFRYALSGADARLALNLEPGALRLDAVSTYYLNLAEAAKTLLATTTYRVMEGTVFSLSAKYPTGYELRDLTIDGRKDGFAHDLRADGTLEIRLANGVPAGREIALAATFEQARADWVPEDASIAVSLPVPSSGAGREEGLVAIGADAAFQVVEKGHADLVSVGAGELTARGISAAGLLYGYRLDGASPALTLDVKRHTPVLEADVVTALVPTPRRLQAEAVVVHQIRRAGVRSLLVDVPAWTQDDVQFVTPLLRASHPLSGDRAPADVPAGYTRWQVDLKQRVIGRHTMRVLYYEDQTEDDWTIAADHPVGVRVPLERSERMLVVRRADGLEVRANTEGPGLRTLDVTDLPAEAALDPLQVLEVLRLADGADGLSLSVAKHDGAAVLNAIATSVELHTAVATEGVLRTRANVVLFNVDRQFLDVRLPPQSDLIGAVVDGKPVKPLTRGDGTLMIPIPTARSKNARTLASLTYETNLGEAISGSVDVPGPTFPNLEVLHTSMQVALEPNFRIEGVRGNFTEHALEAPPARAPWVASLLGVFKPDTWSAPSASFRADYDVEAVIMEDAALIQARTHMKAPHAGSGAESDGYQDIRRRSSGRVAGEDGDKIRGVIGGKKSHPEMDDATTPANTVAPPEPESSPGLSDMPSEDFPAAAGEDGGGGPPIAGDPAPGDEAAAANQGPLPNPRAPMRAGAGAGGRPSGEGDISPFGAQPGRPKSPGARRKGLLSLDVPVLLSPNTVVAQRMGTGGTMTIELEERSSTNHGYAALVLLFIAGGIAFGMGSRARKALFLTAAIALAVAVQLMFGSSGSTLVCALADAATALFAFYALRAIATWMTRVKAPAAAMLCVALLTATASSVSADEPRPPVPNAKGPDKVYIPYDPAKPGEIDDQDRVFLPLEAYLRLHKAAHPEKDPDVVALGRYITLVDARYRFTVDEQMATGTVVMRFAKRGEGLKVARMLLGGFAITSASLDGEPVRLLLENGLYLVPLEAQGDHTLELACRVPVARQPNGRAFSFQVPSFGGATLDVLDADFEGDLSVSGAGRIATLGEADDDTGYVARAYLGRASRVNVFLRDPRADELPTSVVTRAESRTVHSLRNDGTETVTRMIVHVLQGKAPFVDLRMPDDVRVLEAKGRNVVRWETTVADPNRLRLVFQQPATGAVPLVVRTFRASEAAERTETLVGPMLTGATGERGIVVVNAEPTARVDIEAENGVHRTGRPRDQQSTGPDRLGRVVGAWTFAARPASLSLQIRRVEPRMELSSTLAVVFGDDRVRTRMDGAVHVDRTQIGHLEFALPGDDEVRDVESRGMATWWLQGEGDERRLFVRYTDMRAGDLAVRVFLERRLGGRRDGIAVPRWSLVGAQRDRGVLTLYTLPDVEPSPGALPGLKSVALRRNNGAAPHVDGATAAHVFTWERSLTGALPVVLRTPDLEREAVVVSMIAPGDEEHRIEHLVLFRVTRGSTDRLRLFLPDGGHEVNNVIRVRDLREISEEVVTRRGADGQDVAGTLYDIVLQSRHNGLIEVTVSQVWAADRAVRVVQPEQVGETRWFSLVRTFLDGRVVRRPLAGDLEKAEWADLPFVPRGLSQEAVVDQFVGRKPYVLSVTAERLSIEEQAAAVVLASVADVVLGLDGYARMRVSYRIFNRSRQFLRLKLPEGARLYGGTAAGKAIKPLAGAGGTVLIPVPKVPLGGTGYQVSVTYRVRAGADLDEGDSLEILLPEVEEQVEVDRTVVRLYVPEGYEYEFDTTMSRTAQADVAADLAEVALRETRKLLEVAQKGTLEQRFFSCTNANVLLQEAERLNAMAGDGKEAITLGRDIAQLKQEWAKEQNRCAVDFISANTDVSRVNPLQEEFGGNAANLIQLDEVSNDLPEPGGSLENVFEGSKNAGAWRFNDAAPEKGKANKDILSLKNEIESELKTRYQAEARKLEQSIRVDQESKQLQQKGDVGKTKAVEIRAAKRHAAGYDAANFKELNRRLAEEQARNGQLGAGQALARQRGTAPDAQREEDRLSRATTALAAMTRSLDSNAQLVERLKVAQEGRPALGQGQMLFGAEGENVKHQQLADQLLDYTSTYNSSFAGLLEGGPTVRGNPLANLGLTAMGMPDRGIAYDPVDIGGGGGEGVAGGGDGGSREMHSAWDVTAAGGGGAGHSTTADDVKGKVGLMGVDVPLPKIGKVYYFRSVRAGAPITIEASDASISVPGRIAVLVLILGAFVVLGVGAYRKGARL